MTPIQAKQRILQLISDIKAHNQRYYQESQPTIADSEYDALMHELIALEEQFPQLLQSDSPSQRVGVKIEGDLPTVNHRVPMLSLDNTYNIEELQQWYQRVLKGLGRSSVDLITELKIDGVSAALTYIDGKLTLAATRGDGASGEDVTHNIKTIQEVPLQFKDDFPTLLDVRGEVYIDKNEFAVLNKERIAADEVPFVNPRNAASGALKLLDATIAKKRKLKFFAHSFGILEGGQPINDQWGFLAQAKKHGLPTNSSSRLCHSIDDVVAFCQEAIEKRDRLSYDVDGVVVKVNNFNDQKVLGFTAKSPRWAVAFKFPAYQATTTVNAITVQVGRTGVLTPVAELDPVACGGVTISRATLHNFDEVVRLNINVNDKVLIERAGDVIPKVVKVVGKYSDGHYALPTQCPACGGQIEKDEEAVAYRCINQGCPKQLERRLVHFASRTAMDIEGLGEVVVKQLLDRELVKDLADIYQLKEDDLLTLDLFATKKAKNLIASIKSSKTKPLARLIFALGIDNIGSKVSLTLANYFSSLDELIKASIEELTQIPEIGPVSAQEIVNYFKSTYAIEVIRKLKQAGLNLEQPRREQAGGLLAGKKFVFTGELDGMSREAAGEIVTRIGAEVVSSVSKKTDFVVVGSNPGSKYQKAVELGVKVINQQQFMEIVNV